MAFHLFDVKVEKLQIHIYNKDIKPTCNKY